MSRALFAACAVVISLMIGHASAETSVSFSASKDLTNLLSAIPQEFVLINLWSPFCGPCGEEVSDLNRFAGDKRLAVMGIAVQSRKPEREAFIAHFKPTYSQWTSDRDFEKELRTDGLALPLSILLDRNRVRVKTWTGKVSYDVIANEVSKISLKSKGENSMTTRQNLIRFGLLVACVSFFSKANAAKMDPPQVSKLGSYQVSLNGVELKKGKNTLLISLVDSTGLPMIAADLALAYDMVGMSMNPPVKPIVDHGDGTYETEVFLGMRGNWSFVVEVTDKGTTDSTELIVPVK